MKHLLFVLTRLWRYHSLYFLKPHDAVNDTLTSSLLHRLDWSGPVVEIGSGDGVFSYVMHGGSFPLRFDRYLLTDLSKQDIYDSHRADVLQPAVSLSSPDITLAIDAKESHVQKIREIGFAKNCQVAAYEKLPLSSASVPKVFYYTPHGLNDHEAAIREAARVLVPGGSMLILLYDAKFKPSFICHRLAQAFPGMFGAYFSRMDNGRYDEITRLAKSPEEWERFFPRHGFEIKARHSGLSAFAWKVYDIQTRPLLKPLIRFFGFLPGQLRTFAKFLWMSICYPYLVVFYLLFSNEYFRIDGMNCYLAYQVRKV
ncbi:hypothetical protein SUTH_03368 [Sulfuritalea hydrogenivorans sk43H]|uniref:Methyltransferase type 11 domain-containing protein n=1 Tax=Sulfuritalea hydrogenivorans sk43H TaxID=1223802 RepID=W0SMU7_9PROT|nr:hypothetical protein SUTH_03368 [Sulfuritalea hydrogenivorans sk43H]